MRGAKKDLAVTKLLRENGLLLDKRSFVSLGCEPHLYLKGRDMMAQRERMWASKMICGICNEEIWDEWEVDHKQGGLVGRFDDLSNLQAVHPICHRQRHVHPKWSRRTSEVPEGKEVECSS
jgi:HNH endonuclease